MTKNPNTGRALPDAAAALSPAETGRGEPVIPIEALLGAHREVMLLHAGQHYRLRLTANDRLILTK